MNTFGIADRHDHEHAEADRARVDRGGNANRERGARFRYPNPTFGFTVILPAPYRRSEVALKTFTGDKPAAQDVFTARTPADEDALANPPYETACRIWNYVARSGLSAMKRGPDAARVVPAIQRRCRRAYPGRDRRRASRGADR